MKPIIITGEFLSRLVDLDARAKAAPITLEQMQALVAKQSGMKSDVDAGTYNKDLTIAKGRLTVTVTYEHHPSGFYRHLSVSVNEPERLPPKSLVNILVSSLWGTIVPLAAAHWPEDIGEGCKAVNLLFRVPN